MARKASTIAVVLVVMLAAAAAHAASPEKSMARAAELVSLHSSPLPGRRDEMYTVPAGGRLLVMKACVEHAAMEIEVGRDRDQLTYGYEGCVDLSPGLAIAAGQEIYCDNDSGEERACALIGVLEPHSAAAPSGKHRARFTDLR